MDGHEALPIKEKFELLIKDIKEGNEVTLIINDGFINAEAMSLFFLAITSTKPEIMKNPIHCITDGEVYKFTKISLDKELGICLEE